VTNINLYSSNYFRSRVLWLSLWQTRLHIAVFNSKLLMYIAGFLLLLRSTSHTFHIIFIFHASPHKKLSLRFCNCYYISTMLATSVRGAINRRPLASFLGAPLPCCTIQGGKKQNPSATKPLVCNHHYSTIPKHKSQSHYIPCQTQIQLTRASSSFSALPPDEEQAEKERVGSLTQYQREMELRQLDSELARLQTLRAINTGELYTLRGKFKMLSRDYGMGFLAW